MEKVFIFLRICEKVSNDERRKNGLRPLGRGFSEAFRLNKYNPLSYIFLIILLIILFIKSIIEFIKNFKNPFNWD